MDAPVEPEPDREDPPVHHEPYLVRGARVSPPALDLLEAAHRLLLARHGAAGHVEEAHRGLRVHGEVEEDGHALPEMTGKVEAQKLFSNTLKIPNSPVREDARLSWTLGELLDSHQREPFGEFGDVSY